MKFFLLIIVKMPTNVGILTFMSGKNSIVGLSEPKTSQFLAIFYTSGPGCSKLTTSLVNVSLKFQKLISQIHQYFLLKKKQKHLSFFQQKISVYLVIKS